MSALGSIYDSSHPLEVVEQVASHHDWAFERASEDEITIVVKGSWSDYQVSFSWMHDIEALHVACAFDIKIPARRISEAQRLISLINEQMWIGHFDLWATESLIMYRHALMLPAGIEASSAQCEIMLSEALKACEQYYQAIQFVVWAGRSAQEALAVAMFETVGEA